MIYRNSFRKDNRLSLQLVSAPLLTIHSAVQNEKGQCINYTLFIQLFIGIIALPKVIICKDLLNLSKFHYYKLTGNCYDRFVLAQEASYK